LFCVISQEKEKKIHGLELGERGKQKVVLEEGLALGDTLDKKNPTIKSEFFLLRSREMSSSRIPLENRERIGHREIQKSGKL